MSCQTQPDGSSSNHVEALNVTQVQAKLAVGVSGGAGRKHLLDRMVAGQVAAETQPFHCTLRLQRCRSWWRIIATRFSMQQSKSDGRHDQQDPTRASGVRITQGNL
jgi:hypothetical protein